MVVSQIIPNAETMLVSALRKFIFCSALYAYVWSISYDVLTQRAVYIMRALLRLLCIINLLYEVYCFVQDFKGQKHCNLVEREFRIFNFSVYVLVF